MTHRASVNLHFDVDEIGHRYKRGSFATLDISAASGEVETYLHFADSAMIDKAIAELVALKQEMSPPVTGCDCMTDAPDAATEPDDDESGEDATVAVADDEAERANPPHHALPGERACTIPGYEDKDGWVCTAQDGHDGPDHIAYRLGDGEYHRWPVTAVSSDEPASVTA